LIVAFKLEKLFTDVFAPRHGDAVTILYDLPEYGIRGSERIHLKTFIMDSTIVLAMPEFSASAPLVRFAKKYKHLRIASMPGVTRSMEETGLSADYGEIAVTCTLLAPLFEKSDGIEVIFSTGHTCYFDISDHNMVFQDNGQLHPGTLTNTFCFANLPAGEVCTCPNETENSRTEGEIPAVIGNVLEDEKAGFHWAYGRSDHLGGKVGVKDFSSPDKVRHIDIVYAKGNPILCKRLDFVFPDETRETVITDGMLSI